jgi:hypothetical protein
VLQKIKTGQKQQAMSVMVMTKSAAAANRLFE